MKVPALLKNKYVFYGLAVLAVLNVVGYVSVRAYECLALFVLTAYSAHCYCKNESCAILAALFVANFVFGCGRVKEGMEDMMKGPEEHMIDAEESRRKAEEAFTTQAEATTTNCCEGSAFKNDLTDQQRNFCTTARGSTSEADWCQAPPTGGSGGGGGMGGGNNLGGGPNPAQ